MNQILSFSKPKNVFMNKLIFSKINFDFREINKYFLTIIGDAILKKEENNIHIVSPESKEFLNIFSQHLYYVPYFHKNLL